MHQVWVPAPWTMCEQNGSIPDLTGASHWPALPSGKTDGSEPTVEIDPHTVHATVHLPEVLVYEQPDFGGAEARTNLNWHFVGEWWNDRISSIVVVAGYWRFYELGRYEGRYWELGPGYYRFVEDAGIPNNIISSFQAIGW